MGLNPSSGVVRLPIQNQRPMSLDRQCPNPEAQKGRVTTSHQIEVQGVSIHSMAQLTHPPRDFGASVRMPFENFL